MQIRTADVKKGSQGPIAASISGDTFKIGDRIIWAHVDCGECYWCKITRQPVLCAKRTYYAFRCSDEYPHLMGGFAEYEYVIPPTEVVKVPEELTAEEVIGVGCAFRTVVAAYERLGGLGVQDDVVIQGAGPIGLYSLLLAIEGGARKTIVLGFSGTEGPLDQRLLDSLDKIELIRGTAAKMIGLVDDATKARIETPAIPMLAIVSEAANYTSFADGRTIDARKVDFVSRIFYMQEMHKTYSATATVCTGAAAMIEGTLVNGVCSHSPKQTGVVRIGHPSGVISIEIEVAKTADGVALKKAALGRTSRRIMEGSVYVPESLFKTNAVKPR